MQNRDPKRRIFLIATEDEFSALGLSNVDYRGAFADYVDEDGGSGKD